MRNDETPRILSITPATGWSACYNASGGKVVTEPLAVWGVVEEDGEQFIVGFLGDGTPADQRRDFITCCRDDMLSEFVGQDEAA